MNVNPLLMSLEQSLNVPVYPDFCTETGLDKYIVFNYVSERGNFFADNEEVEETTELQVHYFMRNCNAQSGKRELRRQLRLLGFDTYVGADLYEEDTHYNHVVIICEISGEPDYL